MDKQILAFSIKQEGPTQRSQPIPKNIEKTAEKKDD
jgi:hypothetical protein